MSDRESALRALIVDDQPLMRSGLSTVLRERHGVVVVAECTDGDEVPAAVAQYRPDVVVMDLRMARVDGVEATRQLRQAGGPPVLALTTFQNRELLPRVLRAGAAGFLLKESSAEELIRAVRVVGTGGSYLDPAVTARVLTTYRNAVPVPPVADTSSLTRREREVLQLVAHGHNNNEVAEMLVISHLTVKSHLGNIFHKLKVRDRAALIVYAYEQRIVRPRTPDL